MSVYTIGYDRIADAARDLALSLRIPDSTRAELSPQQRLCMALNSFQPVSLNPEDELKNVFTLEDDMRKVLIDSGGVSVGEVDSDSFFMDARQQGIVRDECARAIELLKEADGEAYKISTLVLRTIFWCNVQGGGGSLVQNLGYIWFSPKKHWTSEFYAENIFHEALHHALFLEDMTYGVFGDLKTLSDERWHVTSNFLHIKRRFDLAFHGVFVAVELAKWYSLRGNDAKAQELIEGTRQSLQEIQNVVHQAQQEGAFVMTKHGYALHQQLVADVASSSL